MPFIFSMTLCIYCVTYVHNDKKAVDNEITLSVGSVESLDQLIAAAAAAAEAAASRGAPAPPPVGFQLEIDTAMGRAGFDWRLASSWSAELLAKVPILGAVPTGAGVSGGGCGSAGADVRTGARLLEMTGAYTHFQGADAEDTSSAREQHARYQSAIATLGPLPAAKFMTHVCNSAGT